MRYALNNLLQDYQDEISLLKFNFKVITFDYRLQQRRNTYSLQRLNHEEINLVNIKAENLILDNILPKDYGRIDGKSYSNIVVTGPKKNVGYFYKKLHRYRITSSYNKVLMRETQSDRYNQNFSMMGIAFR